MKAAYRTRSDQRISRAPAVAHGDNVERIAVNLRWPGGIIHAAGPDGAPACGTRPPTTAGGPIWTSHPATCRHPECRHTRPGGESR